MAQHQITDYYSCTKGGAGLSDHALRAAKQRKAAVLDPGLVSTPRHAPLALPSTPPRSCPPAITAPRAPSSRKRVRPADDAEPQPVQSKRSARKRLVLPGGERPEAWPAAEQLASPISKTPLQPATPSSLDKECKNLVNCIMSPNSEFQSRWPEGVKGLKFPMEKAEPMRLVADLQTRLLEIKSEHRRLNSPVDTVVNTTDLKRLKRAKELEAKLRERKAKQAEGRKVKEGEETKKKTNPSTEVESINESIAPAKVPAYQRFHTLAQDVLPGLSLPYNYKMLAEMFRSMDTIVAMLFNRSETVTFAKVQKGVQDMIRKSFDEKNVGQIKTVYPTAYKFRQEKNIPTYKEGIKKSDYQLTVEPLIGDEKTDGLQLSVSRLLERRRIFGNQLVDIVKEHHRAFLVSLDPPVHIPADNLTRWHPRFPVDTVPDILPAELPKPPELDKVSTAQEVLNRARGLMPKMEKALANLALRTGESVPVENKDVKESMKSSTQAGPSGALKGVSQSLLERIRAKEARKMQVLMTRNPQQEEKISMMQRLPEMARILRNVFVSEKKPALMMEVACSRVMDSYRSSMMQRDMEKHLRLLSELVPRWLGIHLVRNETYLKLDKSVELTLVLEALAKREQEEEAK